MTFTAVSLFAGAVDGLGMAFTAAGGVVTHYYDYLPFACANMRRLHPAATVIQEDIRHVKTLPATDVVLGSPPCQGFSVAGHRRGLSDDRYLWPEMARLVRQSRPRCVVVENVRGSVSGGLIDAVCDDLELEGYTCWPFVFPACVFGASHERYRLFIVAHASGDGYTRPATGKAYSPDTERNAACDQQTGRANPNASFAGRSAVVNPRRSRPEKRKSSRVAGDAGHIAGRPAAKRIQRVSQSRLGRAVDGSAGWLDGLNPANGFFGFPAGQGAYQHAFESPRTVSEKAPYHAERIEALGNAVVWQQALPIMQAVIEWLQVK